MLILMFEYDTQIASGGALRSRGHYHFIRGGEAIKYV